MLRKSIAGLLGILVLLFGFVGVVSAQRETPEAPSQDSWQGQVTGKIVNQTPGAEAPGSVSVMLHAWDQHNTGKLMLHGEATPESSFLFEDVSFEPGLVYAVMATYQDAMYFSDPVPVEPGQTSLEVEVPVYETTDDASEAIIDQMHVLFYFDQGGLSVSEVFVLSNTGDHSIQGAIALADGTPGTVKFPLPEDAANISFSDNGERFLQAEDGFIDTAALVPGEGVSQVAVSYILPYEDGRSYSYIAPLDVGKVSFMAPKDSGLTIEGEGLEPSGDWPMQDGTVFSVFSRPALKAGETVQLSLSGQPQTGLLNNEQYSSRGTGAGIGVGVVALGLALIFLGIWWWRKPQPQVQLEQKDE